MDETGAPSDETKAIPRVTREHMLPEIRDAIAATTPYDYTWTDDWSPAFYRAQARLGFIAIAGPGPDGMGNVLLPELQQAYAVLDWPDLVIDRGVRKILENGRLESDRIRLKIQTDPDALLSQLARHWAEKSWIVPEYNSLIRQLATPEERVADPGFAMISTVLFDDDQPVAGELGYAVGRVYVSLSGFLHRDSRRWNHFGKLQMVLLAGRLQSAGFAFWNLGHPQLDYKTRLGAQVVPRIEFLRRWDEEVGGEMPLEGLLTDGENFNPDRSE